MTTNGGHPGLVPSRPVPSRRDQNYEYFPGRDGTRDRAKNSGTGTGTWIKIPQSFRIQYMLQNPLKIAKTWLLFFYLADF